MAEYYEVHTCGTIVILILYVRKLQLRELKELASGQSASEWQSWHRNSRVLPLSFNKYWPSVNSMSGTMPGTRDRKMKNRNVVFPHRVYRSGRIYKYERIQYFNSDTCSLSRGNLIAISLPFLSAFPYESFAPNQFLFWSVVPRPSQ